VFDENLIVTIITTDTMECLSNNTTCVNNITDVLQGRGGFEATPKKIFLATVLIAIDVLTVFGNLLVLMSFLVEKRLLQPFNLYILNLAVTDFLVAITAMTFYTIDTLLGFWPFGKLMCGVWIYFDFAMTFASVFTLVAISINRFWSVTWFVHYKTHNTRARTVFILLVIWYVQEIKFVTNKIAAVQNNKNKILDYIALGVSEKLYMITHTELLHVLPKIIFNFKVTLFKALALHFLLPLGF